METESRRPKWRAVPELNAAIETLNFARDASSIAPAKAVFSSVSAVLAMIRDAMINRMDYVELGLACADICTTLDRGLDGKQFNDLNSSVREATSQLTTAVEEIKMNLIGQGKRSVVSQHLHADNNDKEKIAAWRLDLDKILQVFNALVINTDAAVSAVSRDVTNTHITFPGSQNDVVKTLTIVSDSQGNASKSPEDIRGQNQVAHASASEDSPPFSPRSTHGTVSNIRQDVRATFSEVQRDVASTHTMVPDIHRTMAGGQEGDGRTDLLLQTSIPGEPSSPAPRPCFGRDELIEETIGLAEDLIPIALIGVGGIGKTSIALTVLHHDRIKQRFGPNRQFIRCDQFPASHIHLLSRLSKVIGAGIKDPEDLASLRPFLSSKEIFIVLDNAESILDPRGMGAREIYAVVEELNQLDNICLCVTSRISIIPAYCEILDIQTLSIEAARDTFYWIYKNSERPDLVDNILEQSDFHPLSVTLLATAAHHNRWDVNRLIGGWEQRRTNVLQTEHNKNLAATIELSLASPMFQKLGPDARALLEVIAFFPQGVNENNADWLLPTISDRTNVFDKFCILSLTHRNNGFVTMLAPLRDYLSPKDPKSSSLLCAIKECYFTRLLAKIDPDGPSFEKTQWIASEDVNVEHLLDVFTTIDPNSDGIWDACTGFMHHLFWHKHRLTIPAPKVEGLPDDHRSKPECLLELSQLIFFTGYHAECKRLLTLALELWRERGDDDGVARTLMHLSGTDRLVSTPEESVRHAREVSEAYERLGATADQARCLITVTFSLYEDNQLDAAEEAAFRAISLLPESGQEFLVSEACRTLGNIYKSKGETTMAIHYFEAALGVAPPSSEDDRLFWIYRSLARLFLDEGRFDDAHAHIERAKSYTIYNTENLVLAMELQAVIWYTQGKLEEARSEALPALDFYEEVGFAWGAEACGAFLQLAQEKLDSQVVSGQSALDSQGTE